VYDMDTHELYCPSVQAHKAKNKKTKTSKKDKQMTWTGNAQKAKNVGMTIACTDCNKPRCLYSSKKITGDEKEILVSCFDTICYTFGATFACYNKTDSENDDPMEESSQKRNIETSEGDNILS